MLAIHTGPEWCYLCCSLQCREQLRLAFFDVPHRPVNLPISPSPISPFRRNFHHFEPFPCFDGSNQLSALRQAVALSIGGGKE